MRAVYGTVFRGVGRTITRPFDSAYMQFKLCLLTYKALHGQALSHIANLCR